MQPAQRQKAACINSSGIEAAVVCARATRFHLLARGRRSGSVEVPRLWGEGELGRTSSNFEVESGLTCVNSPRRNYSFSRIQILEGHVAHNTKGHGW